MTMSCSRYLYQKSLAASNRWPVRLHVLLIWSLLLVFLPGGIGSSSVGRGIHHHNYLSTTSSNQLYQEPHSNIDALLEASEWLSDRGIQGLCHPDSDEFAPVFPRCSYVTSSSSSSSNPSPTATATATSPSDHYKSRQLEEDSYYSYYRYEDDAPQENGLDDENIVYADPPRTKWYYIFNGSMALACVIGGALASGLTVGLLSLDPLLLVIKMRAGETEKEKLQAEKLLPLVKQHHRLLVTLLLLNTVAGEALPVFLQGMVPDVVAILISVILVLVFGEILPTAFFTGPNQIQIASHWAPSVKVLMFVLFPITYPIARLQDKIMIDDEYDGEEEHSPTGNLYNRGELAALIRVQYEERLVAKQRRKHNRKSSLTSVPDLDGSEIIANIPPDFRQLKASLLQPSPSIDGDEVMIVEGALQMKTKTAMDIFLSFHKVFCIPYDMVLDEANIFLMYCLCPR